MCAYYSNIFTSFQVDGERQNLPVKNIDGIKIYLSGQFVTMYSTSDVSVAFDGRHWVKVKVPYEYRNRTCGLCANFDGDKNNDMTTKTGVDVMQEPNPGTLVGNSWKVSSHTDKDR